MCALHGCSLYSQTVKNQAITGYHSKNKVPPNLGHVTHTGSTTLPRSRTLLNWLSFDQSIPVALFHWPISTVNRFMLTQQMAQITFNPVPNLTPPPPPPRIVYDDWGRKKCQWNHFAPPAPHTCWPNWYITAFPTQRSFSVATHGVYQTAEHGARFCRQQDKHVWLQTAVQLHTKLYSSKEELENVATFNLQTAFSA